MQLTPKRFSHRFLTLDFWSSSRNCRILGREHASNHVSFRVSLSTMRFYQACFDPEPPCCLALSPPVRSPHRLFLGGGGGPRDS